MRPTIMEVDLNIFKDNIKIIKDYVGDKEIMPVIKANGYGTYINKRIDIINDFNIVAVAMLDEAIELRKMGYKKDIFILNQPYIDEVDKIIEYNVIFGISSFEFLNNIVNINKKLRVHLEIETGMNRTGINIENLDNFIDKIKNNDNIIVEGIYTHFSSADIDHDYTNRQINVFEKAVCITKNKICTIKYIHASSSNGILNYNLSFTNLVRPGLIMYGYETFDGVYNTIGVKPICNLKSKVIFLKEVECGQYIGYSKSYLTNKKSTIATIPIGYADGFNRMLSNKGRVVINGKIAPIVGNICMDSIMVDVTNIPYVKVGSDVYIWDNDILKLDEIAKMCGTINYEIISGISNRVPRVFI